MQIPTCWDLQGSLHTSLLVGHTQLGDLIGQYMQHISDFLYLHIGVNKKVFTYDFETIKDIIPKCWHTITWEYLSSIKATATLSMLHLQPQQKYDSAIMRHAF